MCIAPTIRFVCGHTKTNRLETCKKFKPKSFSFARLGPTLAQDCGNVRNQTTDSHIGCPACRHLLIQSAVRSAARETASVKGKGKESAGRSRHDIQVLRETAQGSTGFTPSVPLGQSSPARRLFPQSSTSSFRFTSPHLSKHAPPAQTTARRKPVRTTPIEQDARLEVYARAGEAANIAAAAAGALATSQRVAEAAAAERMEHQLARRNAQRRPGLPRIVEVGGPSGKSNSHSSTLPEIQDARRFAEVRAAPSFRSVHGSLREARPPPHVSPRAPASGSSRGATSQSTQTSPPRAPASGSSTRGASSRPPQPSSKLRLEPPSSARTVPPRRPLPAQRGGTAAAERPLVPPPRMPPLQGSGTATAGSSRAPPPPAQAPSRATRQTLPRLQTQTEPSYAGYELSGAELDPELMRAHRTSKNKSPPQQPSAIPSDYVVSPLSTRSNSVRTGNAFLVSPPPGASADSSDRLHPDSYRRRWERQQEEASRGQSSSQRRPGTFQEPSLTVAPLRMPSRAPSSAQRPTQSSSQRSATQSAPQGQSSSQRTPNPPASTRGRSTSDRPGTTRGHGTTSSRTPAAPSRPSGSSRTAPRQPAPLAATTQRQQPSRSAARSGEATRPRPGQQYPPNATQSCGKKFLKMLGCQSSPIEDNEEWVCRSSSEVERSGGRRS